MVMMSRHSAARSGVPLSLAVGSIAGFWGFYCLLMTLRSLLLNPLDAQIGLMGLRILVCLLSAAVTFVLYAGLARINVASLRRRIASAFAFAGIAAAGFGAITIGVYRNPLDCIPPPPGDVKPIADTLLLSGLSAKTCASSALTSFVIHYVEGYFLMVAWAALYLAFGYAVETGAWKLRAAELRAAAQLAELRALRYQVNPHFLFNTLNSLTALVMTRRLEEAEQMIRRMSTFFRTSLSGDPTEDVSLGEEIELQRLYLGIEAVRFPDRLRYTIDVPDTLMSVAVPGLILQPLVENAIKHGVARSRTVVTVVIAARDHAGRLELRVSDDGFGSGTMGDNAGIGLRNVSDRLAARFGDDGSVEWTAQAGGGFNVALQFPKIEHGC
jgi:two-component system LytT family sensor kinase